MTDTKDNFWTRLKKELENNFFNFLRQLPFYVICWGIGFYLLRQSAIRISLDNEKTITTQLLFLLLFSIFLLLLPFAKKIKFLNVFEIEREIKETKQEVRDFKSEIRQSLSILTNSLNASIGNMHNQVTVQIPGIDTLKKANKVIEEKGQYKDDISYQDIKEELSISEDEDTIMALAKTRIKIETLLREILNKRTTYPSNTSSMKFLSLNELFRQFTKEFPEQKFLTNYFQYVQQVCNAAIHGLNISLGQAEEALQLGTRIIKELEYMRNNAG
jgi:hypothetical protein